MRRIMISAVAGVFVSAAVVAGAVGAAGAVAAAPARHHSPKITVSPRSQMVNDTVTLTGTGFKPHTKLVIWECSKKFWIVPQQVCNHRNAAKVRTNAHGGFTVKKFKVLVCPEPKQPTDGFSRRCWVGLPKPEGVDTVALLAAARITVTGP